MDIKICAIAMLFLPLDLAKDIINHSSEVTNTVQEEVVFEDEEEIDEVLQVDFEDYQITIENDSFKSYEKTLEGIRNRKYALSNAYNSDKNDSLVLDSMNILLTESLLNQVIPYWYGTPWAFEGHTNVPNVGEVACGYLVSTTLKHMGVNLNRYKMAQQAALLEIKSIDQDYYKCISCEANAFLKDFSNKKADGIYIIGLDNHVGFLLKRMGEMFFVHSDYINGKVNIEVASNSEALIYSESFYVGDLSNNVDFLKKWLSCAEIIIITS